MTVNVTRDAINVREKLAELDKPTGIAGEAMLRAETPQEQFNLIGAGRRNLIINGAMQVAQRGTSASVSDNSNEGYSTLDRWATQFNSAIGGSITYSQSSDAPSGFANSAKIQCASTHTPASYGDYLSLRTTIEAQDLQQLAYGTSDAKEITLSWYMKVETYSGPISVGFQTKDGTSEYFVKSVTPTSSWTRYSITVPASTTATINNDNGAGLQVEFVLSGDTANTNFDRATDSTAWETTRYQYVSDVGNILSNTSNAIYITGVQLELGKVATPFEHRSYGEELALCQRYYQYGQTRGGIPMYDSYGFYPPTHFNTSMRANPTVSVTSVEFRPTGSSNETPAYIASQNQFTDGFGVIVQASSSYQDQNGYGTYSWTADAEL